MTAPSLRRTITALAVALVAGLIAGYWDELGAVWRGVLVGVAAFVVGLVFFSKPSQPASGTSPLTPVLEQVLADETRRPWNPTTFPWLTVSGGDKPILLVPAADYHLAEIVPLSRQLETRGHQTRIAIGESPWRRTWAGLAWYHDLEVYGLPDPASVGRDVAAVVTMKDTGSMTDWVTEVRARGVPVIGKVEGAQDFWDADTPEERRPYHNLDLVLCQGQFDADALYDQDTAIVGSSRLERLWWAPPVSPPARALALINLNFVYGVRSADRKRWLDTAIEGCDMAEIPYVISVHPAEKAEFRSDRMMKVSASRLLPHATVLISRFSTLPFEAMARGIPFIYANPHGETVRTFSEPRGAFDIALDGSTLKEALLNLPDPGTESREKAEAYFTRVVDTGSRRSEGRSADRVERVLGI